MKPFIVTLTGLTCSGKSTLEAMLRNRGFVSIMSHTTRPPRNGEENGEHYFFVSDKEFDAIEKAGGLIESVQFNGYKYGASAASVEMVAMQDKPIVIVCEPNGRAQIEAYAKKHGWGYMGVFLSAPAELIANRFLTRIATVDRNRVANEKRLTAMLTVERGWLADAHGDDPVYDLVVDQFDGNNQGDVAHAIETFYEGFKKAN